MRRPTSSTRTTLNHAATPKEKSRDAATNNSPAMALLNQSNAFTRRNSSTGSKNNSPIMNTRKMPTMQSPSVKRTLLPVFHNISCGSSSATCCAIKRHGGPIWKARLFSTIGIVATVTLFVVTVLTDALFLFKAPSDYAREPLRNRQALQFLQNQSLVPPNTSILAERNLLGQGHVDSVQNTGTEKNPKELAPNTKTFCPKDGIFSESKDDDDTYIKGPVIDMTDLRQLSNRDNHFKDSKCPRNIQDTKIGTTLVTQATVDRLPFVKEICQRWASPMIVVVCLSPSQVDGEDWKSIRERYDRLCPQLKMVPVTVGDMERDYKYPINRLRNRGLDEVETSHVLMIDVDFIPSENLDQAVLKAIQIHMEQDEEEQKDDRRNRRRQYMSDKLSISSVIRSILRFFQFGQEHRYRYRALVVPAFERKVKICQDMSLEECIQYTSKFKEFMPRSIESLKQCMNSTNVGKRQNGSDLDGASAPVEVVNSSIESSKCIVFHSDYFPKGHGDTKSAQWLKEGDQNSVRAIPCINIDAYEPYLALPWCPSTNLNHYTLESAVMDRLDRYNDNNEEHMPEPWAPLTPYYDERFYGYGKNKLQHIFQLQQTGYAFSVIPAVGFLTHHPHPDSNTKIHWKERSRRYVEDQENVKVKMKRLYKKFKCEMEQEYERLFPLPTESC